MEEYCTGSKSQWGRRQGIFNRCKTLKVDGESVELSADGTYTFKATKNSYTVKATFAQAIFWANATSDTGVEAQLFGKLYTMKTVNTPKDGQAGLLTQKDIYRGVSVLAKQETPGEEYIVQYAFAFTTGKTFVIRLESNPDGTAYIRMLPWDGGESFVGWSGGWEGLAVYKLNDAEINKLKTDGINYRVTIVGENAEVYLDNKKVATKDLSKDVSGQPTNLTNVTASINLRVDGNVSSLGHHLMSLGV